MKPARPARLAAPVLALAAGAAFGLVLPRGPQSGPAVVAVVLVALALGVLLGHPGLLGPPTGRPIPRWPLPLLAWLASEVARWPVGEHLPDLVARAVGGSTYAVGVLALGRGVDLLVGLLPFAVGLALWRRSPDAAPRATRPRIALAGLVAVASLASLAPASTPVTPGAPGNLAEVATVRIGGCDHRLVVRGAPGRPVVFFLSGGPGGTEVGTLRNQWAAIEREFTGAGHRPAHRGARAGGAGVPGAGCPRGARTPAVRPRLVHCARGPIQGVGRLRAFRPQGPR